MCGATIEYGVPNGISLSIYSLIFAPVWDHSYFMPRRGYQLVIFLSPFEASGFISPWALSDRCIGHCVIQIADQPETLRSASLHNLMLDYPLFDF
jgi:hypothetical protein